MESLAHNIANAFIALIAVIIAIIVVPDRGSLKKCASYFFGGISLYIANIIYLVNCDDCAVSFANGLCHFIKMADDCVDQENPFLIMAQIGIISGFIILLASPLVQKHKEEIERNEVNSNKP